MANLKDVALHAGVSASTVSRVLAGKSYVNEKTRQRVLSAVNELSYSPNSLARSLKDGKTNTIALMVPSIQNLIYPEIARGVEDYARRKGITVILCNTYEDADLEKEYIEKLRSRWIDGFIVCTMRRDSEHIRSLQRDGFPLVLAIRHCSDNIDTVAIDNVQAARTATDYLLKVGCRRIALAIGDTTLKIYSDREQGYRESLAAAGIAADERLIMRESTGTDEFYQLTKQLFSAAERPDAVFCSSDPKALFVMRALLDLGLDIPGDVSVMGIDNADICALVEPPLTTISQPLYDAGAMAVKKLLRQIEFRERGETYYPSQAMMPTELIVRSSTK